MASAISSPVPLPNRRGLRIAVAGCLALASILGTSPAGAVPVEQVPSPRPAGWAIDLTGTLSPEALAELDRLGEKVKAESGGAELAVVVVGSTDGVEPREYATRLFNAWGLGERGRDNGILVFAALDDHAAEIVLGTGIDLPATRQASDEVLQGEMVPRFRDGDPGGALLAGARGVAFRVLDVAVPEAQPLALAAPLPAESATPLAPPPAPQEVEGRSSPSDLPAGEGSRGPATAGIALLAGIVAALGGGLYYRFRAPRCPDCKAPMVLLNEVEDDRHLDRAEQIEEEIGSVDHQVWLCTPCGKIVRRRWNRSFSGYGSCPQCDARTCRETSTTLETATYSHGGRERVEKDCASCGYHNARTYSTPRLERERDSDSSWGSSASSSRGSSNGGSSSSHSSSGGSSSGFGGGSSSGGGASGRW